MGNPWAYDFSAIGQRKAPLLIILGCDGEAIERSSGGYHVGGNSDVYRLLPESVPFEQLNLSKQFLKQPGRPDPARFDCVLNLVTDPDQHPRTLERLGKLLRGYRGRIVNRPEAVLRTTRDQVARRLAGIDGLRVPKVLRVRDPRFGAASAAAQRRGLSFPVILRRAGTHTGDILGLVDSAEQLDSACTGPGEFIITEFVDFASGDGLYRKYRLWSFGGRAILKHMFISDRWNVHSADRSRIMPDRPDLIAEEKRTLATPERSLPESIHRMFRQVQDRMGLDFFGMDFGILPSGEAVLFEANATMGFQMEAPDPRFAYLDEVNEPARAAFMAMLGLQA
jgi:glutathione synthase/RimK-type ligase-like ATP-grasp enzyme